MRIAILIIFLLLFSATITPVFAQQQPKQEYLKARITKIVKEGVKTVGGSKNLFQIVQANILDGTDKNKTVTIEQGGTFLLTETQKVKIGETVILSKLQTDKHTEYRINDVYRLDTLLGFITVFFILVIVMAGKRGFGSIIGMLISLIVICLFIVPQIMQGANPLFISIVGSFFIMVTTIYLAHGFSQRTTIAIIATFISLVVTIIIALISVGFLHLSGVGSEDIYMLVQGFQGTINFQGLLLGGIIIGTLGVLDDTTTTQTTTIYALADANPGYTVRELFIKGMNIGREHITSLVNTLVLAYAGASIGVFIFLILGQKQGNQPLWVMLNSEFLVEEIVRTLAGSIGLVLAVPITTLFASFFAKYSIKIK